MTKQEISIIDLKDWLPVHIGLLKEDKTAALMQCCLRKAEKKIILCNIDDIPDGYTVDDIVDILNGKYIKL